LARTSRSAADDFPTTPGVLQAKLAGTVAPYQRSTDGFVSKLNPTGTALLFSTYLGGSLEDRVNDLQMGAQGNIWVTGATASTDLPGNPASFTGSFFALVSADGTRLPASQRTPTGAADQAIRAGGTVAVLGVTGSVLQVPGGQVQGVAVFGVASAAGNGVKAYVAPGEFVSLYGSLLGPSPGVSAILDSQGRIANQLAGVQVLFNGIPSPLLYASQGQVNALVPYGITGGATASVQVTTAGGNSPAVSLNLRPAQPGVFNSGGAALALNQDNSVNSPQNPAAPGSIVTIFASGAGRLRSSAPDGSIPSEAGGGPVGGRAPQQPLARSVVRRECSRPGNQPPANQPALTTAGGRRRVSTDDRQLLFRPLLTRCPVGREDKRLSIALPSPASRSHEGIGDSAVGARYYGPPLGAGRCSWAARLCAP
jgi:uncharacterized protein (TIGR03437 family)